MNDWDGGLRGIFIFYSFAALVLASTNAFVLVLLLFLLFLFWKNF
jgi:hypothetical protein